MTDHDLTSHDLASGTLAERKLPPIAEMIIASMAFVIASGIYLASFLPKRASLGPVVVMLVISGLFLLAAIVTTSRLADFAWDSFFLVAKWAMLAYLVISGTLEFVFVFDGTRGSMLAVFTVSLAIFALDIPMLLSFSVARYQESKRAR